MHILPFASNSCPVMKRLDGESLEDDGVGDVADFGPERQRQFARDPWVEGGPLAFIGLVRERGRAQALTRNSKEPAR